MYVFVVDGENQWNNKNTFGSIGGLCSNPIYSSLITPAPTPALDHALALPSATLLPYTFPLMEMLCLYMDTTKINYTS